MHSEAIEMKATFPLTSPDFQGSLCLKYPLRKSENNNLQMVNDALCIARSTLYIMNEELKSGCAEIPREISLIVYQQPRNSLAVLENSQEFCLGRNPEIGPEFHLLWNLSASPKMNYLIVISF